MPMYNHNDPATHDGTDTTVRFGGPYEIYISINGQRHDIDEVGKGDELRISFEPIGETDSDDDE